MAFVSVLVYFVAYISVYHFCINPQLQACFVVSIFWGISFLEAGKGNASTIYKGMPYITCFTFCSPCTQGKLAHIKFNKDSGFLKTYAVI